MTIKECIDIVDNAKPNQYSTRDKVMWLSFIDEIIINDVLKTHEGYDGKYDDFEGYTEDKLSVPLIVPSPYDRLYTAYLKMKIDGENGETARYNNSASLFNSYMMEYRKFYNKTHMPLDVTKPQPTQSPKKSSNISDAVYENLKRELYYLLSEDFADMTSQDKLYDIVTSYVNNNMEMLSNPVVKKAVSNMKTANGTLVSQNADFAEVAEWADGNPNNEDRTGYFVCANVPVKGIVMRKATSKDDVKGVSILAPAFAGNYTKDKLDSNGNLLPKYSYVAIIGFVPVRDNGTCIVGGRCMPDDNGCAIPSSNNMGYQVVNRIDENRVLIIIEPNGDMVQRIKAKVNEIQNNIGELARNDNGVDTLKYENHTVRDVLDTVIYHDSAISNLQASSIFKEDIDAIEIPNSPSIYKVPSTYLMKNYVESLLGNTDNQKYELIETIEVTEDTTILRTKEPDGTPYNFSSMFVQLETTAASFPSTRLYFQYTSKANPTQAIVGHDIATISNNTGTRRAFIEVFQHNGWWDSSFIDWHPYIGATNLKVYAASNKFVLTTENAPIINRFASTSTIPAGTTVKIWGVRAQ